ncbi:MAG TPA: energy transducer TonB [Anaeromyxobacteraceae bacterium]|nr:energy transducer TonB [Anaeromyxobacteraceae bacterium]
MTGAVLGALGRRERLWPVAAASAAAHALLLLAAALARPAPVIDLEQKPIVARLVRLGEERPKQWLPRKEAESPPPAAPAAVPVPGAAARAPDARATGPERPDRLASVMDRLRREKALGEPSRFGSPSGSPLGESSEEEGDRYLALVQQALHANYRVPATISEADRQRLQAVVVLAIQPDGRIAGFRFEKKSGHPGFDEALERAVRETRLPPPPPEMRQHYREKGLGVRFHM